MHGTTMIILQEIITHWTKQSRGAERAARRHAVPDILPLPSFSAPPVEPAVVHQLMIYREANGFQNPEQKVNHPTLDRNNQLRSGCVVIHQQQDLIEVVYAYDMNCGGAPERTSFPRKVLALQKNTWGRIQYNGRFVNQRGEWTYRHTSVNIGYFDHKSLGAFDTPPVRVFHDLADLY